MQGRRPPSTYNLSSINHPMNSAAMQQIAKYWSMRGVRRTTSTSSTDESLIIPWAAAAASAAYSSSEPSWEEQAFARDAAANLVWPPRSYSCTFCHREFRSAQALGGHMNVHRRDRARLRQGESPSPDDNVQEALPHDQNQPHQDSFMYRAISNLSATIIEESKNKVVTSKSMSLAARDQEAINQYDHNDEKEESGRTKRKRVDQPAVALPIFMRSMAVAALAVAPQGFDPDAKVHKTTASPSSSAPGLVDQQEVDLELRLGTTPKVS